MTNEELLKQWERGNKAVEKLPWHIVRDVRNANKCLYPLNWERIQEKLNLPYKCVEDFEKDLKELCDSLYNWGIYEECPKCHNGIKIPVWAFRGYTAFCGCSNYPKCNFSMDRGGEPIYER